MTSQKEIQHKVLKMITSMPYVMAFIFAATLLTSCDDDDDNGVTSVQGSWLGNKTVLEVKLSGIPTPLNETDNSFSGEVEFRKNGTAVYSEDGEVSTGSWAQNGNKLILTIENELGDEDLSGTYTIQELNSSRLRLYIEKEGEFEDPESGMIFDASIKASLYFDKE